MGRARHFEATSGGVIRRRPVSLILITHSQQSHPPSDPHPDHQQQNRMDGLNLDPADYLATKRLGSLKWLVEPASSAPSPSHVLPVHQCVCCEAQADILQHVAHFLTAEELPSLASASPRLADLQGLSTRSGEVDLCCGKGPLVPPFGLTTCANDETRTGKGCHHHARARFVQQPLRTESNGHALYRLDMEKPQRILAAGGARGENTQGGNGGAARNALATEYGNGHSSASSPMTGSNAQISGMGSNGRPLSSSKERPSGGKEDQEVREQGDDQQAQAHARLKRHAATFVASLAGGGVMVVFVVWQKSVTSNPPNNNGTILLAVYALLGLVCLGVGLWMWQMYSDRQRQSAMMPTASMPRRTRGKRRDQQQVGNGEGGHAPDRPTTRDDEAQILLETGGADYGSGRDRP